MDSEAAVIRQEMSQTRADLDQKLAILEQRARELRPQAMAKRYLPSYPVERAIGVLLTLIGSRMAWGLWRARAGRRTRLQETIAADMRCY